MPEVDLMLLAQYRKLEADLATRDATIVELRRQLAEARAGEEAKCIDHALDAMNRQRARIRALEAEVARLRGGEDGPG